MNLSTKKVTDANKWKTIARMRAPRSPSFVEIKTEIYCHTFNEAIDLFKDSFSAEYNAFIDFMQ